MKIKLFAPVFVILLLLSASFSIQDSLPVDSAGMLSQTSAPGTEEGITPESTGPGSGDEAAVPAAAPSLLGRINTVLARFLTRDMGFGQIKNPKVDREGNPVLDENGIQERDTIELPLIVLVLFLGAIFFTFWYRFINIRGFRHSLDIIRGKYDNPDDAGEISHFRALTSALSATIGLGNIAGVAIAIQLGGPGAVFWMLLTAVFGMTSKFSSCTLSQMFRKVNSDGSISGGPMYYLDIGLRQMGRKWGYFGKFLAVTFALFVMGGAIGGGNMFQVNQTVEAFTENFRLSPDAVFSETEFRDFLESYPQAAELVRPMSRISKEKVLVDVYDVRSLTPDLKQRLGEAAIARIESLRSGASAWGIGIIFTVLVGAVILGGIKRIGAATSRIVPLMCGLYMAASLYIILFNFRELPHAFKLIFTLAFSENAFYGGFVGVMVYGITRAAFSNEAGLGSAAIAHAAAKTKEPVREGLVAMMGPFIDTIIICFMTALVVIVTGAWNDPSIPSRAGVTLTTVAFGSVVEWFPYILTACIGFFAYSTMISWCYYGERGWIYLLDHINGSGLKTVIVFRLLFLSAIIVGAVNTLSDVLTFTDLLILSMAFPNITGSIILAPRVRHIVDDYWKRYRAGGMPPVVSKKQ